jgi:hypothetical protein
METSQPPQVSVSGSIVIQEHLTAPSSPTVAGAPPDPPSSRWKFWQRWRDFRRVTAYGTISLAAFTALLALGTIALAILSRCQISDLRQQFEVAQRPYVWWDSRQPKAVPTMDIGQKASWDFHFFNYGKSPAVAVQKRILVVFGEDWVDKIDHCCPVKTRINSID